VGEFLKHQLRTFAAGMGLPEHLLSGDLSGFWALKVDANWRVIFRFDGNVPVDIDLVDYH